MRLELEKELLLRDDFPQAVLNGLSSRGQAVKLINTAPPMMGTWVGISIDPNSRELRGGAPSRLRAHVEGAHPGVDDRGGPGQRAREHGASRAQCRSRAVRGQPSPDARPGSPGARPAVG